MRPMRRMRRNLGTLPAALLALAAAQDPGWDLETPHPVDGDVAVRVGDLSGLDCARCHREVAEEWATTTHGFAWIDPFYREELEDRRKPEDCHGCHIPQPVHLTGLAEKPVPREAARELGVACESCHRGPEGTILGPRGTPTEAHVSKRAETFVGAGTNELCAACHGTFVGPVIGLARDFATAEIALGGASCVGCHMAEVERRWANLPEGESGEEAPLRKGRSHALQTPRDPAFLRRALGFDVKVEGEVTVLSVESRAGHRVPGLIGRVLELEIELLGADGAQVATAKLSIDTDNPLKEGEARRVELAGRGAAVLVRGKHIDPRLLDPVPFLEQRLEVPR